jgi:hypothetical protein
MLPGTAVKIPPNSNLIPWGASESGWQGRRQKPGSSPHLPEASAARLGEAIASQCLGLACFVAWLAQQALARGSLEQQ